jgi:hypothetical protein
MTMSILSVAHERRYPPRITEFTSSFWQALALGMFRTTRCRGCRRLSFPPKPICPYCWNDDVKWENLATSGRLYSWTTIHAGPAIFEPDLPYAVGIVDLDAGIRLACSLHGRGVEWECDLKVGLITLLYTDGALLGAHPI